jgi:protein-S-isoprenylcysteine O-methyltransferase Ste14
VTALRHALAILLLPAMVTIVVPALLVVRSGGMTLGGWGLLALVAGVALVGLGLFLMARTIALFATVGKGTLAPWDPPRRLVVRGVYRHVRNPMITGVLSIVLGEALALGSMPLLCWFVLFLPLNAIYMPLVEERMLLRRFGGDYAEYRRNVPRWIPRLRPWDGGGRRITAEC